MALVEVGREGGYVNLALVILNGFGTIVTSSRRTRIYFQVMSVTKEGTGRHGARGRMCMVDIPLVLRKYGRCLCRTWRETRRGGVESSVV